MSTNRENAFLLSKDSDKINSAQSIILCRDLKRMWDEHRFAPISGDLDFGNGVIYRDTRIIGADFSTIPTQRIQTGTIQGVTLNTFVANTSLSEWGSENTREARISSLTRD